mgnify:CR=1 FL=1
MNRQRRKKLQEAFDLIGQVNDILDAVKDEEEESMENLPDSFRYGDKGEEMQNYIDMIDETIGYLEDAQSVIEQI